MTYFKQAIAVFNNKVKGQVLFQQDGINEPVFVKFDLHNLPKNKVMAIHIHEYGDITNGCKSLGGHWNPFNKQHGSIFLDITNSHAGDLINNLKSDSKGNFSFEYYDARLNIIGNIDYSIIGRSVVIHKGIDDLGLGDNKDSKITGNAGKRLDCAIIGIRKSNIY